MKVQISFCLVDVFLTVQRYSFAITAHGVRAEIIVVIITAIFSITFVTLTAVSKCVRCTIISIDTNY